MRSQALIDKDLLHKLERLTIHWQKSFPGLIGGHNPSRFSGPGQEFMDHRNFHNGDDLRSVNWRAYLRLEKLFLKMFQVEPRVPVRMLIDTSTSMTTGNPSKFEFAQKLAASLCYIGLVRLDTICLHSFATKLGQPYPCGGGRHRFAPVVDYLRSLKPNGVSNCMEMARDFVSRYPQRGLLIILSDFLDERELDKALQFLADYGHELMLVHVWAEEDRTPPWDGELQLRDAETGEELKIAFDEDARAQYTQAFDAYATGIQRVALRNGGRYVGLSSSLSLEEAIFNSMVQAQSIS